MDNFMHRGGRMPGSSKLYGSNRPQDTQRRFGNSRMLNPSRPSKDSQNWDISRQHEDLRMQDSRLLVESGIEQNYPPPRIYNSEVQGSVRIPGRAYGGSQPVREVRLYQDSRMESGKILQDNSRTYDMPLQDHPKSRSSVVAYDYNHRRTEDGSLKDDLQPKFMTSQENVRSGRSYHLEENESIEQGILDSLPNNSLKKDLNLLLARGSHESLITPGSSHILTPSLTSAGPQSGVGMRAIGNRDLYSKEKSSKAFDYLKTWRLKMNMPTDTFLVEKNVMENQPGVNVMPSHSRDDWYTQPPSAEPRRASIDQEWNSSGNPFAENEAYREKPGSKYGNLRFGSYDESVGFKDQSLDNNRTGNPPWKWDEELASGQNQGGKRSYESMALGQGFNQAHRDDRFPHDTIQPKRSRFSPSVMQSDRRGTLDQYSSVIPEQDNLSQNIMNNDDSGINIGVNSKFYESQRDWNSPFHSEPVMDSNKFSRFFDGGNEGGSSGHKLAYGEMKGVGGRERPQPSFVHSRDIKSMSHLNTQRSPEPLGRHQYTELHDRSMRIPGQGAPRELCQELDQGRPPPSEMFMSSAPYSPEMSPRPYHGIRSHRSPPRLQSPEVSARGKSPSLFSRKKLQEAPRGKYSDSDSRGRSSPWRKGRSPGPGRDRAPRPERGRSPGPAGLELTGRKLQRSPGTQELPSAPKRGRSPELTRRVRSSIPARGRSPGHQIRERSPGSTRRERSPMSPGRGNLLDHGRWSPPALHEKGRSQVVSSGRFGGESLRPLSRDRSTGKLRVGGRGSLGSSEKGKVSSGMSSKSSRRGKSPGPQRNRSSGNSGRARSPGTGGSYRLPRFPGKGKQADAPERRSSPRLLVTGKPSKTVKGGSAEQQQPRSRSSARGVSVERKVKVEQASSSHHSRGRSPMKGRSPISTRVRPESFSDGKQRPMLERFPRNRSRSPLKRMPSDHREKNETLFPNEYRDYRMKTDRSPYFEEVSLSPRSNRYWSPTGRTVMNARAHQRRGRSSSVDGLQRGCSPVSIQSEGNPHRNIYPQEPFFADRGGPLPDEHSPHIYRSCSPLSLDGYAFARMNDEVKGNRFGRQEEGPYSLSRELSFGTGREDRSGHHNSDKKSSRKISSTKDVKPSNSTKYTEKPEETLPGEEDDEDLRIHLLRLREQKVEMKLMKLEEESKETELKLLELKQNQTAARETTPLEEERMHLEKEPIRSHGRKHENYSWKQQQSTSPQRGRFYRQNKRF